MERRRLRSIIAGAVIAIFAVALSVQPAQAAPWYYFKPGHPMGPSTAAANNCTGSWAVRGPSGLFFLTAGRCQAQGTTVHGLTNAFGKVLRNDLGLDYDGALVQPHSGVDGWQDVVNKSNTVIGHTVGRVGNGELEAGMFVNKAGRGSTGWNWGQLDGRWLHWGNAWVMCGNYDSGEGDGGAPIFTRDAANRAWAVGMHVGIGKLPGELPMSCFITIDDLLAHFGAELPVFSFNGAMSFAGPSAEALARRSMPVNHLEQLEILG